MNTSQACWPRVGPARSTAAGVRWRVEPLALGPGLVVVGMGDAGEVVAVNELGVGQDVSGEGDPVGGDAVVLE